ncbi:MAG TPA: BamA/TamA family outer membrane protein [Gemmatimonadales bacterium]
MTFRFPRVLRRTALLAVFLAGGTGLRSPAAGQSPDSVTLAPGPQYRADLPLSFLGSWVYGKRYRNAWTTPITVPRFDPSRFAGGLTPLFADTGVRAGSHYFRDGRGELWTFRTFDPNLSALVPGGMRKQAVTGVLEDLASGNLPGAALVVGPLAEAIGVTAPPTRLVAWDSVAGYLTSRIDSPYLDLLGATDGSITTSVLLDRMVATPSLPIDEARYLRERLFDIYVGHWDPTPQYWRWVPMPGGGWVPASRSRDGAFARYDGLITVFTTAGYLRFASFGSGYDRALGVTPQLRVIDRRILTAVPDSLWNRIAASMQAALTDSVIADATRRLPAEYQPMLSERLAEQLRDRRDNLPEAARRFRGIVLQQADVYGSAGADTTVITRDAAGHVTVQVNETLVHRFEPKVTSWLHFYPLGGPDQVIVRGPGSAGPVVQIAGTPGLTVVDSSRARLEVFSPEAVTLDGPGAARIRTKALATPRISDSLREDLPPAPGPAYSPVLWLDITSELGVMLGAGAKRTMWSPDYVPWKSQTTLRAGYSSAMRTGGVELKGQWRLSPTARPSAILNAKYSGMENLNYFGYGNETLRDEARPDSYYWAGQTHLILAPGVRIPAGAAGQVDVAVVYKNVSTTDDTTRFIVQEHPYGVSQGFNQLGAQVTLALDTRDNPMMASRGIRLEASGTAYPAHLDAEKAFGKVRGVMAGTVTPAGWQSLSVAARAAAEWAWGQYPVHEAAFLGGSNNLRSHKKGRFSGDAAVYGNLDARLRVFTLPFILRWDAGVYGLGDVGRVYLKDETSTKWHYSAGGGLWVAASDRSVVGRVELATGDDGIGFRFGTAFKF